jgi:acyl carrier protein
MTTVPFRSRDAITAREALEWIAQLFEEPEGSIRPERSRAEIAAWDSLGQLVLLAGLDQRFGIRLNQDEMASLKSVGDILRILGTHDRLLGS